MGLELIKGIVNPVYKVYETGSRLDLSYINALLMRLPVFTQGVTQFLEEQKAVIEQINCEKTNIDNVRAAIERTIVLLKERRATLIAEAVTGQTDLGIGRT